MRPQEGTQGRGEGSRKGGETAALLSLQLIRMDTCLLTLSDEALFVSCNVTCGFDGFRVILQGY